MFNSFQGMCSKCLPPACTLCGCGKLLFAQLYVTLSCCFADTDQVKVCVGLVPLTATHRTAVVHDEKLNKGGQTDRRKPERHSCFSLGASIGTKVGRGTKMVLIHTVFAITPSMRTPRN